MDKETIEMSYKDNDSGALNNNSIPVSPEFKTKDINAFQFWHNNYPYPVSSSKDHAEGEDGWESSDSQPKGERWPPLGAPNDDEDNISASSDLECKRFVFPSRSLNRENERLKELEDEQEQLNNSLLALTSHFAQVQFRLKQIVDASPTEKETLLVELEEFANRGIPDMRANTDPLFEPKQGDPETRLDLGQERQKKLIGQLKQQLEDLENYAYQTGEAGPPQSIMLQKQRVIIDQLKGKLNLNVDDFDNLSVEDLKSQVDKALKELINPLRMKDQLVSQLQTQIVDLERFIGFLQDGAVDAFSFDALHASGCRCEGHLQPETVGSSHKRFHGRPRRNSFRSKVDSQEMSREGESMMDRATTLLSMLTFAQLGCGGSARKFERNSMKKTPSGFHWGDLRAELEVAVASVVEAAETSLLENTACDAEARAPTAPVVSGEAVTSAVRKFLCPALRNLIQHGLMPVGQSKSLVPFLSCLPQQSQTSPRQMLHAWDFILKYYHLKKGDEYNKTPARKLSQSFNLDISGSSPITNKQLLLQTIGAIVSTHAPLKRSSDSHFKAFISSSINQNKLITFLRLIFRTQGLVENYYQSWSYVAKTGFEDGFRSLEQMSKYNFYLPVDMAVKPFQNIRDVFS